MATASYSVNVSKYLLGLTSETKSFAFQVKIKQGFESNCLDKQGLTAISVFFSKIFLESTFKPSDQSYHSVPMAAIIASVGAFL